MFTGLTAGSIVTYRGPRGHRGHQCGDSVMIRLITNTVSLLEPWKELALQDDKAVILLSSAVSEILLTQGADQHMLTEEADSSSSEEKKRKKKKVIKLKYVQI